MINILHFGEKVIKNLNLCCCFHPCVELDLLYNKHKCISSTGINRSKKCDL